jgi:HD-GYP domain-containing protein (c-di-GMP phosphodiesterase class II)
MRREIQQVVKRRASAISVALDKRDQATLRHCQRVAGLSAELGRRCGLSPRELRRLQVAAAFHDVGKIGIPDAVLKKRGRLTEADWAVMRTHCERGQQIVRGAGLTDGDAIGLAIRHHHERYDGAGYPDGLAGEAIPFMARIIAIADAYDAMATPRIYGPIRPHAEIVAVLSGERGKQHDPHLSDLFLEIIDASPFRASCALESAS